MSRPIIEIERTEPPGNFYRATITFDGVTLWTGTAKMTEEQAIIEAENYIELVNRTSLRCVRRSNAGKEM